MQLTSHKKTQKDTKLVAAALTAHWAQFSEEIKTLTANQLQSMFKLVGPPGLEPGTNGFWFV